MLPYVDQYRSSFCTPTAGSPEKPISAVHHALKNKPGSQNRSSSSTEKDSLMSNEKNNAKALTKGGLQNAFKYQRNIGMQKKNIRIIHTLPNTRSITKKGFKIPQNEKNTLFVERP